MHVRLLLPWLLAPLLPAQVALADLGKLARDRAERARPAQEAALQPFWADLVFDYRQSAAFLEPRIQQAAALGDSVIPLLLEKLQPAENTEAARHLASNCRRVLALMDPSSFVDALIEYTQGKSETAREEAIRLLGHAQTPAAVQTLVGLLDRSQGEQRRLVLRSLRQQAAPAAAPRVVGLLASSDRQVREEVLNYLIAAKPAQVADTVIQALPTETDQRLWPLYIEYFAAAVKAHDGAARALLTLLGEKLEWQETRRLLESLATVAPRDHEPTMKALQAMVDNNEPNALAVQAATTLRAIGDNRTAGKLRRALDELLKRRKKDASLHELRANLLYATEDFGDAFADYEKMLEFTEGLSMSRRAHVGMIRCQVHRKRWVDATKQMKASGMTVAEIEALAYGDPWMEEALAQERIRSFLQALAKEQTPK